MLVVIGVVVEVSTDITTFLIQFTAGDPVHGYKRPKWNNYRCGSTFTAVIGDRSSDIVIYSASTHTHSLTQKPRSRHTHTHTHTHTCQVSLRSHNGLCAGVLCPWHNTARGICGREMVCAPPIPWQRSTHGEDRVGGGAGPCTPSVVPWSNRSLSHHVRNWFIIAKQIHDAHRRGRRHARGWVIFFYILKIIIYILRLSTFRSSLSIFRWSNIKYRSSVIRSSH